MTKLQRLTRHALLMLASLLVVACDAKDEEQAQHDGDEAHAGHEMPAAHEEQTGHEGHRMPDALAAGELADTSVYHVGGTWIDQDGDSFELESLRGHPTVVLFFYGSCEHVCPMLIHDVQEIEGALSPADRERTRLLLVTINPERDTPEVLRAMATEKGLSLDRYRLVHSDEMHTRGLAALLGVQYRDNRNGQFSHSNLISLLDASGVPVASLEGLQQPNEAFVSAIAAVR